MAGNGTLKLPEWLTQHGATLKQAHAAKAWFVIIDNQPLYRLVPVPATGRHGCAITQCINGRRIPSTSVADSEEEAVRLCLVDLGKFLGWCG